MVPGVSRSGATIVGALLIGADKRSAAEFSFFLSMPTMAGAFAYDLYKNRDMPELRRRRGHRRRLRRRLRLRPCSSCASLLDFVSRRGFALFGWWRIVVGAAALLGALVAEPAGAVGSVS